MTTHTPSNARIPFTGARGHYQILGLTPVWVYHKMATGVAMNGDAPETATTDAAHTDPAMGGGIASFTSLTKGGKFVNVNTKKPMVVEAVDNASSVTVTIENSVLGTSRTMPTSVPFHVGANEYLKGVTATTGVVLGFLVREDIPAR